MKPKLIFTGILSIFFLLNSYGQIEVNSSGNVGIGVTPGATYKLDVLGKTRFLTSDIELIFEDDYIRFHHDYGDEDMLFTDYDNEPAFYPDDTNTGYIGTSVRNIWKIYGKYVYADNVYLGSDERLKENIRPLISPLEKIKNVRGVKFDFISTINPDWNESKKNEIEYMDKNRIGFIAQELNEVFPELVKYDEKNDAYSVDYIGMIPVLVEAVKEQQSLIEELQYEVENLKSDNNLKSASVETPISETLESNTLFQNSPNPFSESTEIE
jgi:hypothetical protein